MNLPPFIHIDETTRTRFLKFCGIGIVAFLIDVVVFQAVLSLSTASLYLARLVSFVVATTAAWWINRTFTFQDAENSRAHLQWARFFAANLVGRQRELRGVRARYRDCSACGGLSSPCPCGRLCLRHRVQLHRLSAICVPRRHGVFEGSLTRLREDLIVCCAVAAVGIVRNGNFVTPAC